MRFIVDLKRKENSEWTRFPGIKIVDGELFFRGFTVRKITRMGDKRVPLSNIEEREKKEIMKNIIGMIPKKVMKKLNSKYDGEVLDNLKSKVFETSIEPRRNIKNEKQVKTIKPFLYF